MPIRSSGGLPIGTLCAIDDRARVPTADHPPDTVSVEYRKGFLVGGRLVRPATVAVAVPQEEAAAEEPAAEGAAEEAAAE